MTEKDAARHARMKRTAFGVEIEMNHITRRSAVTEIEKVLWRNETNQEHVRFVEAGDSCLCVQGPDYREWSIKKDSSIHGPDSEKCELITPILHYEQDMASLQAIVRSLRKAGARSCASEGCGVHIHISGEGHTVQTIRNLVNLMASHEQQLIRAVGISEERRNRYCRTVDPGFLERLMYENPSDMETLKRCWYNGQADTNRYSPTRYHMLNLHSYFTRYHTIEFRLFQFDERSDGRKGGLHAGQLRAMILLCLAMNDMALNQKRVLLKVQQTENEAYALRCFLLRLGFIGEEFKSARAYFIRNASGNCAWR